MQVTYPLSFTPWTSYVFNSKSVFCNVTNFTAPPKKKKVESDNDWDEEESEEEVKPKSKSRGRPTKIEKPKRWEQIQYINTDNMRVNMFI